MRRRREPIDVSLNNGEASSAPYVALDLYYPLDRLGLVCLVFGSVRSE
jgi:hypothetical protein